MSLNTQEVTQFHPWMRGLKIDDMGLSFPLTLLERLTVQDKEYRKDAADGAANTATDIPVFEANGRDFHLLEARILPDATLTANDTNYATISLKVGATTLASQTTKITGGSGDWVVNTAIALTVAVTDIDEDDVVRFVIEKAGTGVVVGICALQFTICERAPW